MIIKDIVCSLWVVPPCLSLLLHFFLYVWELGRCGISVYTAMSACMCRTERYWYLALLSAIPFEATPLTEPRAHPFLDWQASEPRSSSLPTLVLGSLVLFRWILGICTPVLSLLIEQPPSPIFLIILGVEPRS